MLLSPVMLISLLMLGCPAVDRVPLFADTATTACAHAREAEIGCVLDGDTFDLESCGGSAERIRMLGVQAPEIFSDPVECYGEQAHAYLEEVLPAGDTIRLEFDVDCTEPAGLFEGEPRTLAYVFAYSSEEDPAEVEEIFVNEALILQGYARWYDVDIGNAQSLRYMDQLLAAETAAIEDNAGLWGSCQ